MGASGYQTPLSDFLRGRYAGASGTVAEPRAMQAKFPLPTLQLHYSPRLLAGRGLLSIGGRPVLINC